MYANRYPITLRLALREIWIVSSHIWREYRADARMRAVRRRDARIRERTYRHPGYSEFDSPLWVVSMCIGLAVALVTLFEGWATIDGWFAAFDAWLMGWLCTGAKAMGVVAVVPRRTGTRITAQSQALLRYIAERPGITTPALKSHFHDMDEVQLRSRLMYLAESGFLDRVVIADESLGGRRVNTWTLLKLPECMGGEALLIRTGKSKAPAPVAQAAAGLAEEAPRPVVPPRRPDFTQPWTQPYLPAAGRRPGADDFRALPTLRGGERYSHQPKP